MTLKYFSITVAVAKLAFQKRYLLRRKFTSLRAVLFLPTVKLDGVRDSSDGERGKLDRADVGQVCTSVCPVMLVLESARDKDVWGIAIKSHIHVYKAMAGGENLSPSAGSAAHY